MTATASTAGPTAAMRSRLCAGWLSSPGWNTPSPGAQMTSARDPKPQAFPTFQLCRLVDGPRDVHRHRQPRDGHRSLSDIDGQPAEHEPAEQAGRDDRSPRQMITRTCPTARSPGLCLALGSHRRLLILDVAA